MPSPYCEQAITDAARFGRALLKFISPNDVGTTRSHQAGYYLPKQPWRMFTPNAPEKGVNSKHNVTITWQDGRVTSSVVTWYGQKSRSEYRLTRFGRGFPFLDPDCVGSLLVLIPSTLDNFLGYVFDLSEDIEDIQAGLGIQIVGSWAAWERDAEAEPEGEDECLERRFREFAAALEDFPSTAVISAEAREALVECIHDFLKLPSDELLTICVDTEYRLFKIVERKVCEPYIVRLFASVDDFLQTAQAILQRRKARAGRALENHVEWVLKTARIPFDMRADVEGTRPDILIPGRAEYLDRHFPLQKLFAVGVKTTCKDRWRQVLNEARRVQSKHIITLQAGISASQLAEMNDSHVTLVVPSSLHSQYPKQWKQIVLGVEEFVNQVRTRLAA